MTLSEIRAVLGEREIQLTKSLGQNFLHDGNQLRRIVAAAELVKTDKVLEIGPGLGPLTELLLTSAGEVLAIETDKRLVEFLRSKLAATPSNRLSLSASDAAGALELVHDDALGFIGRERRDWSDWKVVSNLPYSVASPILVELAQLPRRPARLVVTLQLEVAQRLMARADDDHYGVLTLLVQLDYEARDWFKIPAECFFPVPGVDSACVTLVRRAQPLLADAQRATYVKIVKRAFSQRRKMMLKLLKQDWPPEKLALVFAELDISPLERAEKLSVEQFVALTQRLHD